MPGLFAAIKEHERVHRDRRSPTSTRTQRKIERSTSRVRQGCRGTEIEDEIAAAPAAQIVVAQRLEARTSTWSHPVDDGSDDSGTQAVAITLLAEGLD